MRNVRWHNGKTTILFALINFPRRIFLGLIALYQSTLSPDHGPLRHLYPYGYCRHHPTCSEFGRQVITQHGVILGMPRLMRRVVSCHPWKKPDEQAIGNASDPPPSYSKARRSSSARSARTGGISCRHPHSMCKPHCCNKNIAKPKYMLVELHPERYHNRC